MRMDIALLAPVPEAHLFSGQAIVSDTGRVAFGSRAWRLFRDLDELRGGASVDAYIYASHSEKFGPPKVRWRGRYIGHVEAVSGGHPKGMLHRPASTEENQSDNSGHWVIFWELDLLEELSKADTIPMSAFNGIKSRKKYPSSFVPEGPLLIDAI